MTTLVAIQRRVGVTPDGKWGPATAIAVAEALGVGSREPRQLRDPASFFAAVRASLFGGRMTNEQVAGCETLCAAIGAAGWSTAWAAKGLATAYHETARTMQPVREAYWTSEAWRKANLRYWPHYGRGYVQITWPDNYKRADEELELGGTLIKHLDRAMEPGLAARIMVRGMEEGWFAGDDLGRHTLARHLPAEEGEPDQFKSARRIINGIDKASEIARIAILFQDALRKGDYE